MMDEPIKIAEWLRDGDALSADGIEDTDDLIGAAANALDHAYAYDIMGEILFQGEDGKFYVGTVDFVISEADPEYVKDVQQEIERDGF
jgi:hypothetical protein